MVHTHDPEWEKFERAAGGKTRMSETTDPVKKRAAYDKSLAMLGKMLGPTDPEIKTVDVQINEHVKVRVYTPGNVQSKLPLVVFSHGGGWLAGDLETEDHDCRIICSRVRVIIVSIHYRLCPEHKFPIPVDDCWDAYQWALSNAAKIHADPSRLIFWGGSAGGGIAIALTWRAIRKGQPVAGLVTMAPFSLHPDAVPAKYKQYHTSYIDNAGEIPVIRVKDCHQAWAAAGALPPYADNSCFPQAGGAEALKGFPPTYIHNTDSEAMRDDGAVLEIQLKEIGSPVKRDVQARLPHFFWCFPVPQAGAEFRRLMVDGFGWVLDQAKRTEKASL